jgi:hypothetical protein
MIIFRSSTLIFISRILFERRKTQASKELIIAELLVRTACMLTQATKAKGKIEAGQ